MTSSLSVNAQVRRQASSDPSARIHRRTPLCHDLEDEFLVDLQVGFELESFEFLGELVIERRRLRLDRGHLSSSHRSGNSICLLQYMSPSGVREAFYRHRINHSHGVSWHA